MDSNQAYWDARPCNIRHSALPVGTRAYFDEVEWRKYFVEPHIPPFAEFARWRGATVLEIGCGIGTDAINFARYGAEVTAVDLSPQSLAIVEQRVKVYGLGDAIQLVHANAATLTETLTPQPYDLIYAFGVLHHVPDPDRVLEQCRAFTQPGTTLKVMIYHRWSHKALLVALGRMQSEAQAGVPIARTYSQREARQMLARHGFTVKHMSVEHIFPWRVRDYIQYRYRRGFPWSLMPRAVFAWLEHRIGWHLCITAEVNG